MKREDLSATGIKSKRANQAIAVCAQMYLEQGIEAVKMTDIADACGVGVATLYRYFGTKPGITIRAAIYLWQDVLAFFSDTLESDTYGAMSGEGQMSTLMHMFITLYREHGPFLKFLAEFDTFLSQEEYAAEDQAAYEASVVDIYPVCEAAYKKGIADGTLREIPDFHTYYNCYTHGLMALCQKFIRGELLPGDDFSKAEAELEMMIDGAMHYLKR